MSSTTPPVDPNGAKDGRGESVGGARPQPGRILVCFAALTVLANIIAAVPVYILAPFGEPLHHPMETAIPVVLAFTIVLGALLWFTALAHHYGMLGRTSQLITGILVIGAIGGPLLIAAFPTGFETGPPGPRVDVLWPSVTMLGILVIVLSIRRRVHNPVCPPKWLPSHGVHRAGVACGIVLVAFTSLLSPNGMLHRSLQPIDHASDEYLARWITGGLPEQAEQWGLIGSRTLDRDTNEIIARRLTRIDPQIITHQAEIRDWIGHTLVGSRISPEEAEALHMWLAPMRLDGPDTARVGESVEIRVASAATLFQLGPMLNAVLLGGYTVGGDDRVHHRDTGVYFPSTLNPDFDVGRPDMQPVLTVTPREEGELRIRAEVWRIVLPEHSIAPAIEWNDEGEPKPPADTIRIERVPLEHTIEVRP